MKKKVWILLLLFTLMITGCSSNTQKQIPSSELEGLPIEEQVKLIAENTKLIDDYSVKVEEESIAIVYPANYVPDSYIVASDHEDSFPNVSMTLVEHMKELDFDEVVITSYEPSDTEVTGISKVSALFSKKTIEEIDFEEWNDKKEKYPQKAYRLSDAYFIRGMTWEKQDEEVKEAIGNSLKDKNNNFWKHYGWIID